jgi:transposase
MNRAIQSSATLSELRRFVSSFRKTINGNDPDKLDRWVIEYSANHMKELASFAKGLEADITAVKNAIIYDLTNGPVEGMNNRLKALKRSMYGRAGNRLLMIKMIHAKTG